MRDKSHGLMEQSVVVICQAVNERSVVEFVIYEITMFTEIH